MNDDIDMIQIYVCAYKLELLLYQLNWIMFGLAIIIPYESYNEY